MSDTEKDFFISYKSEIPNLTIKRTGYSVYELAMVEAIFISEHHYATPVKECQFNGLCAVVEYLCELDNIPNVMDIQSLFEYENDYAKKELSEVFI